MNDNDEESYLLALDAKTGEEIFRVERDEKSNWATPYVWKNSQRTELVAPGTGKDRSYDLEGRLLWELGGMSSITIALPYSQGRHALRQLGLRAWTRKSRSTPSGPAPRATSARPKEKTNNEYIVWCNNDGGPYNPSSLLYGDKMYVLYDQGFFACFDPATGEEVYDKSAFPRARRSPLRPGRTTTRSSA